MFQKNLLGQDIFLIGLPGFTRTLLLFQYLVSKFLVAFFDRDLKKA